VYWPIPRPLRTTSLAGRLGHNTRTETEPDRGRMIKISHIRAFLSYVELAVTEVS